MKKVNHISKSNSRWFSQNAILTQLWINLEKVIRRHLLVAVGDFNAKIRHWYSQGTNTFEGISIENVTT